MVSRLQSLFIEVANDMATDRSFTALTTPRTGWRPKTGQLRRLITRPSNGPQKGKNPELGSMGKPLDISLINITRITAILAWILKYQIKTTRRRIERVFYQNHEEAMPLHQLSGLWSALDLLWKYCRGSRKLVFESEKGRLPGFITKRSFRLFRVQRSLGGHLRCTNDTLLGHNWDEQTVSVGDSTLM